MREKSGGDDGGGLPVGLFLYVFFYAFLWNHMAIVQLPQLPRWFHRWVPEDPPFMEFSFLGLAVPGGYLVWRKASPAANVTQRKSETGAGRPPQTDGRQHYLTGLIVSLVLTAVAYTGWYWTEVLYDRMVIYSDFVSRNLMKPLP